MHVQRAGRYLEARESYRHPETGQPTSRCVARWPLGRSLKDEISANKNAVIVLLEQIRLDLQRENVCRPVRINLRRENVRRLVKLNLQIVALERARDGLQKDAVPMAKMAEELRQRVEQSYRKLLAHPEWRGKGVYGTRTRRRSPAPFHVILAALGADTGSPDALEPG